jgi:hypothetical protein
MKNAYNMVTQMRGTNLAIGGNENTDWKSHCPVSSVMQILMPKTRRIMPNTLSHTGTAFYLECFGLEVELSRL